jgi:H+/Cl- antiporter ClcA
VARRTVEFGCAIVVVGLLAGVAGAATTLLLTGVGASSPVRRALGPMIGGALAGLGWWLLRRRSEVPPLSAAISSPRPLPRAPLSIDAALQVLPVGSGASLGREGAPRQLAAAFGDFGTTRLALTERDRGILLACAAGAGLGAVYSVPLGGALFTARILLGTWHPRALAAALITSSLAVAVAAPVTHLEHPRKWPEARLSYLFVFLALALSPLAAAVGLAFERVMAAARPRVQIRSRMLIPAIAVAGLATGVLHLVARVAGQRPQHSDRERQQRADPRRAAMLLMLKPLLTALFLRAGAVGGLLTPALATGAATGSAVAAALNQWAGADLDVSAVSLTCAAGVLAITQRAPAFAALLVWELAHPPYWLLLVFAVAAFAAHGLRVMRDRHNAAHD